MDILLSGELYNSCMKALARFLELKRHKRSAANTEKILGATTGFIACKRGGFLAGSTCTLHKIKPNSTSCYKSLTEPQGSISPFKGIKDMNNSYPETPESPVKEIKAEPTGICSRQGICNWQHWKKRVEDSSTVYVTFTWIDTNSRHIAANHKGQAFRMVLVNDKKP